MAYDCHSIPTDSWQHTKRTRVEGTSLQQWENVWYATYLQVNKARPVMFILTANSWPKGCPCTFYWPKRSKCLLHILLSQTIEVPSTRLLYVVKCHLFVVERDEFLRGADATVLLCSHQPPYTWNGRGTVRVKCLAQEHNTNMSLTRTHTQITRFRDKCTSHEVAMPPK